MSRKLRTFMKLYGIKVLGRNRAVVELGGSKYVYLCLAVIFINCFSGCKQHDLGAKTQIEYYLTNNSKKYWTTIEEHPIRRERQGGVYFANGKMSNYWDNHDSLGRYRKKDFYDWRLLNDSIIWKGIINCTKEDSLKCGSRWKIEYLNEDVLVLNNLDIKMVLVQVKSRDQSSELELLLE